MSENGTRDFEALVQRKAEAHLDACFEAMDNWEDGDGEMESPANAPFCGCTTCIVREVLMSVWDDLLEEARRESAD